MLQLQNCFRQRATNIISGSGLSITLIIIFLPVCVQILFSQIFHHKLPIFLCSCQQLNEKIILKYLFFFSCYWDNDCNVQWKSTTTLVFFFIDKKGPFSKQVKNFTFCNDPWVKETKTLLVTFVPWKHSWTY